MLMGWVRVSANSFRHAWIIGYSEALWGSAVSGDGKAPEQGMPGRSSSEEWNRGASSVRSYFCFEMYSATPRHDGVIGMTASRTLFASETMCRHSCESCPSGHPHVQPPRRLQYGKRSRGKGHRYSLGGSGDWVAGTKMPANEAGSVKWEMSSRSSSNRGSGDGARGASCQARNGRRRFFGSGTACVT